jgi:hypothetical protein
MPFTRAATISLNIVSPTLCALVMASVGRIGLDCIVVGNASAIVERIRLFVVFTLLACGEQLARSSSWPYHASDY